MKMLFYFVTWASRELNFLSNFDRKESRITLTEIFDLFIKMQNIFYCRGNADFLI